MQPRIYLPRRPLPGMDAYGFHQSFRLGTCAEFDCEWFLYGKTGEDEGKPFTHPAGVECGDTRYCKPCVNGPRAKQCGVCEPCRSGTANCPCPQRLKAIRESDGRRGHPVPNEQVMPVLSISDAQTSRPVVVSEFTDRIAGGVDMIQRIRTRGL